VWSTQSAGTPTRLVDVERGKPGLEVPAVTHPPTIAPVPQGEQAERRLWTLLAALFALVAGVNVILAVSEAAWWQGALAALCLAVAAGCVRESRRAGD
jgi:fatty acid desaturase